jgi:hypothetical protein
LNFVEAAAIDPLGFSFCLGDGSRLGDTALGFTKTLAELFEFFKAAAAAGLGFNGAVGGGFLLGGRDLGFTACLAELAANEVLGLARPLGGFLLGVVALDFIAILAELFEFVRRALFAWVSSGERPAARSTRALWVSCCAWSTETLFHSAHRSHKNAFSITRNPSRLE